MINMKWETITGIRSYRLFIAMHLLICCDGLVYNHLLFHFYIQQPMSHLLAYDMIEHYLSYHDILLNFISFAIKRGLQPPCKSSPFT